MALNSSEILYWSNLFFCSKLSCFNTLHNLRMFQLLLCALMYLNTSYKKYLLQIQRPSNQYYFDTRMVEMIGQYFETREHVGEKVVCDSERIEDHVRQRWSERIGKRFRASSSLRIWQFIGKKVCEDIKVLLDKQGFYTDQLR